MKYLLAIILIILTYTCTKETRMNNVKYQNKEIEENHTNIINKESNVIKMTALYNYEDIKINNISLHKPSVSKLDIIEIPIFGLGDEYGYYDELKPFTLIKEIYGNFALANVNNRNITLQIENEMTGEQYSKNIIINNDMTYDFNYYYQNDIVTVKAIKLYINIYPPFEKYSWIYRVCDENGNEINSGKFQSDSERSISIFSDIVKTPFDGSMMVGGKGIIYTRRDSKKKLNIVIYRKEENKYIPLVWGGFNNKYENEIIISPVFSSGFYYVVIFDNYSKLNFNYLFENAKTIRIK